MESYRELLEGNLRWRSDLNKADANLIHNLAQAQAPQFLWIGCSDSRVPPTTITGSMPGSIFVHRNIANLVVHSDTSLLSVVYFAVEYLKVKHIIVCGHSSCGGIQAAMSDEQHGFLDHWLNHVRDLRDEHKDELSRIVDPDERVDALAMINVRKQVWNLSQIPCVRNRWETGKFPVLHGWIYNLNEAMIRDLSVSINSTQQAEALAGRI